MTDAAAQPDDAAPPPPDAGGVPDPTGDGEDDKARKGGPAPAHLYMRLEGASDGTVHVNRTTRANVRMRPFVPQQKVIIRFTHGGKTVKSQIFHLKKRGKIGFATFESNRVLDPGNYRAVAVHKGTNRQQRDLAKSHQFHPTYPDLDPGQNNSDVQLFNNLLRKEAYAVGTDRSYDSSTQRAVMAFRKVNGMKRTFNASPEIFRKLANGDGGFHISRPGLGKYVEVDVSRQVMALANRGKAQYVYHVSTGAPSTPSDRGTFRFYRRQPGYNSSGMYYSVYYNRGEATHGYHSVPPYNASHGCIRNPIPNSKFIYNWISLGDEMVVHD